MSISHSRRPVRVAALASLLLLAGCASANGSPAATPTASAPATPAFHLAFLYTGAASFNMNAMRTSLVALSPRDGSLVWSHPLTAAATGAAQVRPTYRFTPFERDGVVYVGTAYDTSSATSLGAIEALDAGSGNVRWRRDVAGGVTGAPAIDGGVLYLTASQPGGGPGGFAEALNVRDGSVRWQVSLDGNPGPPAAAFGHGYILLNRQYPAGGTLLALNGSDGATAWRYDDAAPLLGGADENTAPLVIGETLFAMANPRAPDGTSDMSTVAFDARTGTPRWRYKTGGIAALPVAAGDAVCVTAFIPLRTGSYSVVAGLDLATGRERWRLTPSVIASACVPSGGSFIVAEDDRAHDTGYLVALAAADGREVWRRETGHPLIAEGAVPAAVTDGTVLAYAYAGQAATSGQRGAALLALRASDGVVLWQVAAPDHQEQPPDVEGGVIYAPDLQALDAYSLRDGSLLWRETLVRS